MFMFMFMFMIKNLKIINQMQTLVTPLINNIRPNNKLSKRTSTSSRNSSLQNGRRETVPVPIPQTKINLPKSALLAIPKSAHCTSIKELYLPYNNLSSVIGLQCYTSLINLNLSYNSLSNLPELILTLKALKLLKRLNIRNNAFEYGYEDQIIYNLLDRLEKLDDIQLGEDTHKKRNVFVMANQLSNLLVPAYTRVNLKMGSIMGGGGEEDFGLVAELAQFYRNRRRVYLPIRKEEQIGGLLRIASLFMCMHVVQEDINTGVYETLVKQILLRFQARNNRTLLKSLGIQDTTEFHKINNIQQIITKFQALLSSSCMITPHEHPGKYLQKINPHQIINHPFYKHLQQHNDGYPTIINKNQNRYTLDPQRRMRDQNHNISNYSNDQIQRQRFPIVIYQRNYLQILEEIFVEKIGQLLRVFDGWGRMNAGGSEGIKGEQRKQRKKNIIMVVEQGQKDQRQKSQISMLSNIDNNGNIENNGNNGNRSKQVQIKNTQENCNSTCINTCLNRDNQRDSQIDNSNNSGNNSNHRQTRYIQKPHPISTHDNRKTLNPKKPAQINKNLQKYSLYQINLAYKVLAAFKINKKTRQKAKYHNLHANNTQQKSNYLLLE